ncbi:serine hydrolase domain-containing protein [Candidatus Latescibacterota bacterium]
MHYRLTVLRLFAVLCILALYAAPRVSGQEALTPGSSVRISMERLEQAAQLVEGQVSGGSITSASLLVAHQGKIILHRTYGKMSRETDATSVQPTSPFLVASITKPVTAVAIMLLVERGLIRLTDPVKQYIPEFSGDEREQITVRMLLNHTSGLPDMLPENTTLREHLKPLAEYDKLIFGTPLLFQPGTGVSYQSMGLEISSVIVERVTGMRFRDFVREEIFTPLGMGNTFLGMDGRPLASLVKCDVPPKYTIVDPQKRWDWNSPYWRDLGAPWGGLHSTTMDIAVLLQTFLNSGVYKGYRLLSPLTVDQMIRDQNPGLPVPWGLGWALGARRDEKWFGDIVSDRAFGHFGATGTVAWADPAHDLICVLFTSRPAGRDNRRLLSLVSNAVTASVIE